MLFAAVLVGMAVTSCGEQKLADKIEGKWKGDIDLLGLNEDGVKYKNGETILEFAKSGADADGGKFTMTVSMDITGEEDGMEISASIDVVTMAGNEVFKVAVTELAHIVDETLAANNLDRSQLDWLVPHQANLRIISATAKKLGMSMDNVVVTLDRHGNTSAASVPCALDEAVRDGRIKPGQLVLLEAFGGGFTWGSALVRF